LRDLECVADDAGDAAAGEDAGLLDDFIGRPGVHTPADARVLAFRVFADADHLDVRGGSMRERRLDAGQEADRPKVDVLAEALPDGENQFPDGDVIRHARRANRAQVDRVEPAQRLESVGRHHTTRLQVVVAAPGELDELQCEPVPRGRRQQHAHPGWNHFSPDAVSSDDRDAMSAHELPSVRPADSGRTNRRKEAAPFLTFGDNLW
jgi:hypothetical protein